MYTGLETHLRETGDVNPILQVRMVMVCTKSSPKFVMSQSARDSSS